MPDFKKLKDQISIVKEMDKDQEQNNCLLSSQQTSAIQSPSLWRCPYCEVQVTSAPLLKQHLKICPSRLKEEVNQQG